MLQFVLMGLVVAAGILGPAWPGSASRALGAAGAALAVGGAVVAILAARALGAGLTPFPHPSRKASFVAHGPYDVVRHPIYSSGLLFFGGFSLLTSPLALVLTVALGVVWGLKSSVEERFLRDHYPEYAEYCERTRFRLVPFVY